MLSNLQLALLRPQHSLQSISQVFGARLLLKEPRALNSDAYFCCPGGLGRFKHMIRAPAPKWPRISSFVILIIRDDTSYSYKSTGMLLQSDMKDCSPMRDDRPSPQRYPTGSDRGLARSVIYPMIHPVHSSLNLDRNSALANFWR